TVAPFGRDDRSLHVVECPFSSHSDPLHRVRRFRARFERTRDWRAVTISTSPPNNLLAMSESSSRYWLTSWRVSQRGVAPSGPRSKIAPQLRQTARDSSMDRHLHLGSRQRGQEKTTDARSARSAISLSSPRLLRGRPPLRPLRRAALVFAADDLAPPIRPNCAAIPAVNGRPRGCLG